MTPDERELLGAYALDALSDDERALVDSSLLAHASGPGAADGRVAADEGGRTDVGAYVSAGDGGVGVTNVEDEDRADVSAEVADEVAADVAAMRESAATLSVLTATQPPAELRARILAALAESDSPSVSMPRNNDTKPRAESSVTSGAEVSGRRTPPGAWRWLAAAAAVVGLGLVIRPVLGGNPTPPPNAAPPPSVSSVPTPSSSGPVASTSPSTGMDPMLVVGASDARRYVATMGKATATVVVSRALNAAVIVADGMSLPPSGMSYQVWFDLPGRGMVNAGVLPHQSGHMMMVLHGDPSVATHVGVTMEPAPGSSSPTGKPLALVALT